MPSPLQTLYSTVPYDARLFVPELRVLGAHVAGLERAGMLAPASAGQLRAAIDEMMRAGAPRQVAAEAEDVHELILRELGERVGESALSLASLAKARNDAAVTSLRLWLKGAYRDVGEDVLALVEALGQKASAHIGVAMPGLTHGQVAQPISAGHYFLAHGCGLLRDAEKLLGARSALDECPLGSGALAGTSLPLDRQFLAAELGFRCATANTLDAVSDRDFALDACYVASLVGLHLSRLAEELIAWSSPTLGLLRLPDSVVTRSSILPHKRNPDALELVRASFGRLTANLTQLQVVMKGLPLGYSRDMQEDKRPLFDSVDTLRACLAVCRDCIAGLELQRERLLELTSDTRYLSSDLVERLAIERGCGKTEAFAVVTQALAAGGEAYQRLLGNHGVAASIERRDVLGGTSHRAVERGLQELDQRVRSVRARLAEEPS